MERERSYCQFLSLKQQKILSMELTDDEIEEVEELFEKFSQRYIESKLHDCEK